MNRIVLTSNGLTLGKSIEEDSEKPRAILFENIDNVFTTKLGAQQENKIPFWYQYAMTVGEASKYFRVGEAKLREVISANPDADFVLWNGSRPLIKRKKLEEFFDNTDSI